MSLRVIELFAGLGSQTQALKNIGVEHEVVAISEIDRFAVQSYEALHGKVNNLGDITKIKELPESDLLIYSSPCTDISNAGKQAGITEGSGTRSSLLWEVKRLLLRAQESKALPKHLLMENVKALVGKKFKPHFDNWLNFLQSIGYANYWQILNARDYGIPQNRERVFCVSILNGGADYKFPDKFPLRLRLKDMLDGRVDEKFYLTERALRGIQNSNFNQTATRIQDREYCDTLCSRDYKDPKCVEVGTLFGGKWDKHYKMGRRVYDPDGLSPTVHTCGGGNLSLDKDKLPYPDKLDIPIDSLE
jgi:DNA (cytosine-5)-methyltransferase 1